MVGGATYRYIWNLDQYDNYGRGYIQINLGVGPILQIWAGLHTDTFGIWTNTIWAGLHTDTFGKWTNTTNMGGATYRSILELDQFYMDGATYR